MIQDVKKVHRYVIVAPRRLYESSFWASNDAYETLRYMENWPQKIRGYADIFTV